MLDGNIRYNLLYGLPEEEKLKIGGLIQVGWSELDGAIRPKEWPVADDTVQFDLTQVQIAVGPSYDLTDMVSIYGGPFLHFVHGDWEDVYSQIDPQASCLINCNIPGPITRARR